MLKVIIVEDEILEREGLKRIISQESELELIAEADTIIEGIKQIEMYNPDLLLLDIELKDGYSFNILQHFPNPNFQVIFITGFNQFAIKAFRHSAVDYLLKPLDHHEFRKSIAKAIANKNAKENSQKLALMMHQIKDNKFDKIGISTIDGIQFVFKKEILYCESDGNYVIYHLLNNEKAVSTNILKVVEELLFEKNFFRIHRSYIVNINFIKKVVKTGFGAVIMQNDKEIQIARRRRNEFLELLGL